MKLSGSINLIGAYRFGSVNTEGLELVIIASNLQERVLQFNLITQLG